MPTTLLIDADGKVVWKDQSANYTQRSDPDFVGAAKIRKTNQRFPYQAKYTHCSRSTKRLVLSLNFSQQGILLPDHGCLAHINTRRFHSHRNEQAGVFLPLEMNYLTLGLVSLIGGGCAAT